MLEIGQFHDKDIGVSQFPIWECPECGKIKVIGSVDELKEESINEITATDELVHRPYVDEIIVQCDCGHEMSRIPDVLDVWIDSGVAGWASLYYPQEKKDLKNGILMILLPKDMIKLEDGSILN